MTHFDKDKSPDFQQKIEATEGASIHNVIQVTGDIYVHIGDKHVHVAPPPSPPISRDELLPVIRSASAELRTYRNDIAGIHLERAEVAQIVEWALKADPEERLGMLLDQPGGGKTVVMRDVLERLEDKGVPVLAIKADALSDIESRDNLAERLKLPAPVEECAHQLVTEGSFVVLLDQLDALSLTLSRDQTTLNVMLDTLARLRDLGDVRVVASCRTFDLNNDPRLSTIKLDHKFELQPLSESQVKQVLQAIGVDYGCLLPAHKNLLTVPLHLGVYAQVVAGSAPESFPESFRTLQELYEALWQKRIEAVPPDTPSPGKRIAAIYRLVETMQRNHKLTAPVAVLDGYEAANYLERVRFIRREKGNWLLFHQTLFDYCYARRFVAQGSPLSQEILSGPQGLFERSQMVQVLAYLRGSDEAVYHRELNNLFFNDNLRVHLRLLLIGWFGSLPNPTADELRIARRLMKSADYQARFLQAARGNEGWFDVLNDEVLPLLLRSGDEQLAKTATDYMSTLIERRTDAVLARLGPYLGKNEVWDDRIAFCLSRLDNWRSEEALNMLCDLLNRGRAVGWTDMILYGMARSNPAAGCRALRVYLDYHLDDLLSRAQPGRSNHFSWGRELLGKHAVSEVMEQAVYVCSEAIIEHFLLWFVRASMALTERRGKDDYYPSDPIFAWGWCGEHISEGAVFAVQISKALRHLARTRTADFRAIAAELAKIETLAVQRVLAQAYLANPEEYANDIFEYLIADVRRLNIGEKLESPHYDSCRLYGAAFQHVDAEHRDVLERLIMDLRPEWEQRSPQHYGLTQLHFFKCVPPDLLSETARRRLRELERKFPGFELYPPRGVHGGVVGPPIDRASQEKMSDDNWLRAMRKYDDSGYEHPDSLKGGAYELALSFAEQVKSDPKRFYNLAKRFDETISLRYIKSAISGLAESDAPAEWVFDLARQFVPRIEGAFRQQVCWSLMKRAEAGVPDDLLDTMTAWALHDPDPPNEPWQAPMDEEGPFLGHELFTRGVNSNRGAAIQAVCHCALLRKPPQIEHAFQLLEQAAGDPSTAVRTCVVESLGPLLEEDAARALAIFERTLEGHPYLLQTFLVHRFLYLTYYHHFPRIRPFIEALLADANGATRQAGANIVCLAAFQHPTANELAGLVMQGDVAMRRGAAQVYAHNLGRPKLEDRCKERLLKLMYDPDESVRAHVGECFDHLRDEQLESLRPFIEQFLDSPALMSGAEHLVKYLTSLADYMLDLSLMVTEHILDVGASDVTDVHKAAFILERDLVRLPLSVYTHTLDPDEKSRAMDLFEHLLLLGSREARKALEDWDRR